MRNPYLLHLRHSIFLFVAPVLAVVGSAVAWSASYPSVSSPANIANVVVSTGAVLSPVLAGFAAWDGLRERRNGGGPILDVAVQPGSRILLAHLAAGLTYASLIWGIVFGVLQLRGLALGLVGPTLWVNLAVSLSSVLLATCWGYGAAGLIRHWTAIIPAVIAPLALYGTAVLGPNAGLLSSLLPFGNRAGGDFMDVNTLFFFGQLLTLAGCIALLVGVIATSSRVDRWWGATATGAAILLAVSGIWTVQSQDYRWGVPVTDATARLVQVSSPNQALSLFILPTYRPVEPELLSTWQRVQSILADTPAAFSNLRQSSDSHPQWSTGPRPLQTIYLNPTSQEIPMYSVLESVIDIHTSACEQTGTFETALVEMWLAGEGSETGSQLMPEHVSALAALRALDDEQSRSWMSQNFDAFADCAVELASFPPT